MAIQITDGEFGTKVLESELPVLVDFWAPWCGPCRMLGPVIDELSKDFDGKAHVYKVNVDENPESARKYGIRSIPALKIFKGGEVVDNMIGALPKEAIVEKLNQFV